MNFSEIPIISTILITICLTVALTCSILAITLASLALIQVKSLERSTHSMQYVPMDPAWASSETDLVKGVSPGKQETPELDSDEIEESELDLKRMI